MIFGSNFPRSLRLRRLHHHTRSGLVITPIDHPISDGPVLPKHSSIDLIAGQLAAGCVDAIVVHKGMVRHIRPERFDDMSLIIHLSASTARALDPDDKYIVTEVDEALRLGADAVSVHVNLGSDVEARQIADLGRISDACDRWNLPLLAMMYPRGPRVSNPYAPELVAHAVTVAAELGADLVKTSFPGSASALQEITSACPIPVLIAGGSSGATDEHITSFVGDVLAGGAHGIAMGRRIFQSADPRRTAALAARLVHRHLAGEISQMTRRQQNHDGQQVVLA